jgi:MYXO-CTERM domain-containing protein
LSGGNIVANFLAPAVFMPHRTLAKRCKRFTPLLAAPAALLLIQGEAKAILTYNIFDSAGNVVVQASGSLDLTGATPIPFGAFCGANGALFSAGALVCTGPELPLVVFGITGPSSFNGSVFRFPASSVTGLTTLLIGASNEFGINSSYISNAPINSSATFNGTTLAGLGFTTTGLIGTWTLNGTSESIQVILGAPTPPGTTVPGPLPLLGAGAAFGWSRRLRKRIAAPLITPPQA